MASKKHAKKATKAIAKQAARQTNAKSSPAAGDQQIAARTIRIHPPPCSPGEIEIDDPVTGIKMCVVPATDDDVLAIHAPPCIPGLEIEFDDPVTGKKMCRRI